MDGIDVFDGPQEEEPDDAPAGYFGGPRHKHRRVADEELHDLAKPDYADCGGENPVVEDFVNKRLVIEDYADRDQDLDSGSEVANKCVICLIDQRSTLFVPCGHLACCADCADILTSKDAKCPICRSKLQRVIKNVVLA